MQHFSAEAQDLRTAAHSSDVSSERSSYRTLSQVSAAQPTKIPSVASTTGNVKSVAHDNVSHISSIPEDVAVDSVDLHTGVGSAPPSTRGSVQASIRGSLLSMHQEVSSAVAKGVQKEVASYWKTHKTSSFIDLHHVSEMKHWTEVYVFDPSGYFLNRWNPVIFGLVVVAVAMAPFELAFHWWQPPPAYKVFGKVVDVLFITDILLHFNTAIEHNGHLQTNRRKIAIHYAKTYLLLDLVSNLPYDWFVGSSGKTRKLAKILKLPKILRFFKLLRYMKEQLEYVGVSLTLGGIVLLGHYFACVWALFLVSEDCLEEGSCPPVQKSYLEAFSVSLFTMVGSEAWFRLFSQDDRSVFAVERQPRDYEDLFNTLFMVCGLLLVAGLFANMASAITLQFEAGRNAVKRLATRKLEMSVGGIPSNLQQKVLATYKHMGKHGGAKDGILRDDALSMDLRREMASILYGASLRKVAIFSDISDTCMKCLAQRVAINLYTPGDLLTMYGEVGRELFIIQQGRVQFLDRHGSPLTAEDFSTGSYFGEHCFLNPGARRTASVLCVEFCRAMVLTIDTFQELRLDHVLQQIQAKVLTDSNRMQPSEILGI